MGVLTNKRGRPRYVADLNLAQDLALPYYEEFYAACRDLSYRDIIALARRLGCTPRSLYRWKHLEKCPRFDTMLKVIEWTAAGKPIKLESQAQVHKATMF